MVAEGDDPGDGAWRVVGDVVPAGPAGLVDEPRAMPPKSTETREVVGVRERQGGSGLEPAPFVLDLWSRPVQHGHLHTARRRGPLRRAELVASVGQPWRS